VATALCIGANIMGFTILCFMYYNTGKQSVKQLIDLKLFRFMQLSVLLFLFFDTLSYFALNMDFPYNREINIFACAAYFVLLPGTIFLWFLYCDYKVYSVSSEREKSDSQKEMNDLLKRLKIYYIPLIFITLLSITSQITGLIFYIDANNFYHRGDFMWLSWLVIYGYSIGSYYLIGIKTKNKPALRPIKGMNIYFYLFQLPPIILGTIQILLPGTYLIGIGMVISIFIIFVNIHNKRLTDIIVEQREQELTQSRITTMLSQIQPHFIYNSLSAISDLCKGNPEAQKALVAFSDYLRVNMSSLTQKTLIPFESELSHVKHYLLLEKLRFEERLQIVYDIKATDFKIPVLSIQPVVESAVSYGLFNKPGVGTVRIRTVEEEDEYVITVVDDGIGYDTDAIQNNEKGNTGIENVRSRIASMCGGTLTVSSKPGIGTRVNIRIPKGVV